MTKQKRPQRHPPRKDTVRLAGRRFTRPCADTITSVAKQRGQSPTALIVDVLERWAKRHDRRPKRKTRPSERGGGTRG